MICLDTYPFHKKLISKLKNYNLDNLNHIMMYGSINSDKNNILYVLLNHLFHTDIVKQRSIKNYEFKIGNNTINIEYASSNYHFELNLYEYGYLDRDVITEFISKLLDFQNINNSIPKIFILKNFSPLSKNAQTVLRQVLDKSNGKFIIIADSISSMENSILSRFHLIRIPHIPTSELKEYIYNHFKKSNVFLPQSTIESIISKNNQNILRIHLDIYYNNYSNNTIESEDSTKSNESTLGNHLFDKKYIIDQSLFTMIETKSLRSFLKIRDLIYKYLLINITPINIFKILFQYYSTKITGDTKKSDFLKFSSSLDYIIRNTEYDIMPLEYYILYIKKCLNT